MKPYYLFSCLVFISLYFPQINAEEIDKQKRQETIHSIGTLLSENYVFPEIAEKMNQHIQAQLKKGDYAKLLNGNAFADKLTKDLQSISKDKHLRIMYGPEQIAEQRARQEQPENNQEPPAHLDRGKQTNYGFQEVKLIDGNIGYLNLTSFSDTDSGGDTAVAAMNFLSNANALIIDLRQNGGGSPSMIQLITSYLYDSEPVHLNNFYWRPSDSRTQTWTLPHVSGQRRPDIPVYVLTSQRTFSAAEEFSYNLRNLERATIVGETTGGGAHPGGTEIVNNEFMIWLPQGRAINPITNTNWEGVGVKPHVETSVENALNVAHEKALQGLSDANPDEKGERYRWYLKGIIAKNNPVTLATKTLKTYVGKYGPRAITLEKGELYYQRDGRSKMKMSAMDQTTFSVEGYDDFRLQFSLKNGKAVAVFGLYDNGHSDNNPRNK
jgi:C-terminal processing protease CtpA/Prc